MQTILLETSSTSQIKKLQKGGIVARELAFPLISLKGNILKQKRPPFVPLCSLPSPCLFPALLPSLTLPLSHSAPLPHPAFVPLCSPPSPCLCPTLLTSLTLPLSHCSALPHPAFVQLCSPPSPCLCPTLLTSLTLPLSNSAHIPHPAFVPL